MTFWLPAQHPLTDGSRVLTARSLGREGGWQLRHGYHDGQRWMQATKPTSCAFTRCSIRWMRHTIQRAAPASRPSGSG